MPILAIVVLVFSCLAAGCDRAPQAAVAGQPDSGTQALVSQAPVASTDEQKTADARDAVSAEPRRAEPREAESAASKATYKEVTLPAGTVLPLVLDTPVASDRSRVEQAVTAHIARPVRASGLVALPTGSAVHGVLTSVVRSGKVKGRAHVAMQFDRVTRKGGDEAYRMETATVGRTAPATKKDDTLKVVAPAAGGAIIGRIAGGRKGAAIGTAVGAGAGGAVVVSTRGKEVRLGKGALLSVRLSEPLTVRVPIG